MKQVIVATALVVMISATVETQAPEPAGTAGASARASATLEDAEGRAVGEARLQETTNGVLLTLELTNATPGVHALHLHTVGKCEAPTFETAGGHFAPRGREHGFLNPRGAHAGDMPNIHVPASRQLSLEYLIPEVTLEAGPNSLLDADGSAIVMHAGQDDYRSDPSGDAGGRLACGVVVQ